MPYWITDTLAGIPAFLWIYVGLGGLWSLVLLPRDEWRHVVQVIAVAFALGPALLTAWMFVLGTVGMAAQTPTLTYANILSGTAVLSLIALALVARKLRRRLPPPEARRALLSDERLLIGLIVVALLVRWVVTAYWPFTAYDALWVYGYEARLYALTGFIPAKIGYYPQFVPLQYTYAQLNGLSDHMARAVIPLLHLGSILAAYVLGSRLFNRRTGIILMGLWALYPQLSEWARMGDLEVTLAFLFTLAAAFFLVAWNGQDRRRNALVAGVILGIGLWTKPTMGAFILGVGLMLVLDLMRLRFDYRRWWPRLQVALLTGIAALPLGGVWYVRNLILGHAPLVFPPTFWQTLAERRGAEFGWPLLALLIWAVYLVMRYPRYNWRLGAVGLGLVAAALLPTILVVRRMSIIEFALLGAGLVVLAITVRRMARDLWDDDLQAATAKVGWGMVLVLPYFATWFYSYSYHYRLSFAIVPLMILPTAVILARVLTPERIGVGGRRFAYLALIVALAVPGVLATVYDPKGGWDYLWTDKFSDDTARYRSGNAALMNVVDGLQVWVDQHPGDKLVVSAPGVDRLPFFFPLQDIRVTETPTRLAQLDDATYFVYGSPEGSGQYLDVPPLQNQVIGALDRQDIMRRVWGLDDGIFRYDVYELHLANRWTNPQPNGAVSKDVVFGGAVRYLGYDIGGLEFWPERRVTAHLFWQVLQPLRDDYSIYIHLLDGNGKLITTWDGTVAHGANGYYSTLVWEPGEYISDQRVFQLPEGVDPVGEGYQIVIGIYNSATGARLPVTVDGQPAGSGYTIEKRIAIRAQPPG